MKYIIGGIILFATIWIAIAYQKGNSTQQNSLVTLWIPLLAILVSYLLLLISTNKNEPDYRDLNRPYLVSQIEILDSTEGWYDFQFIILNKGKLPATNITYDVFSTSSIQIECKVDGNRTIAPGEEFSFRPFKSMPTKDAKYFDAISLVAYSSAKVEGKTTHFKDVFNFKVHLNQIVLGKIIRPSDKICSQEQRVPNDPQFAPDKLAEGLDRTEGSVVLNFKLQDLPKGGKTLFGSGKNKKIFFDPVGQEVYFSLMLDTGEQIMLRQRISPAREIHSVVVTWKEQAKEFVLVVDGDSPR